MAHRFQTLLSTVILILTLDAQASSIGVYFDAAGTDCDTQVQPFVGFNTYILANLYADAAASGLTGAEFRVTGVDPAWFSTISGNPAAPIQFGNPLQTGCNIAFSQCQTGTGQVVLLYTVSIITLAPVPATTLRVLPRSPPSNSRFPCPLVTLCDAPAFSILCVSGGEAFINGGTCAVSVSRTTWTAMKSLYAR